MSALPPRADISRCRWDVRKVPLADIALRPKLPVRGRIALLGSDMGVFTSCRSSRRLLCGARRTVLCYLPDGQLPVRADEVAGVTIWNGFQIVLVLGVRLPQPPAR